MVDCSYLRMIMSPSNYWHLSTDSIAVAVVSIAITGQTYSVFEERLFIFPPILFFLSVWNLMDEEKEPMAGRTDGRNSQKETFQRW